MQSLSTQDSIKTKQLLPDRFWIIEHNGSRIGTIQRHDSNQFIITGTDSSVATLTLNEVTEKFDLFSDAVADTVEVEAPKECYDYPTKHIPYNAVYDVQHKLEKHVCGRLLLCEVFKRVGQRILSQTEYTRRQ